MCGINAEPYKARDTQFYKARHKRSGEGLQIFGRVLEAFRKAFICHSSIATHTCDSADVNLDNISGLPRVPSTRWLASFSEGLHLFAAQRPTVASSHICGLNLTRPEHVSMLDKARVAIQTCIQTLISNIEQDNGVEPATQQGTMGTQEEGDDEIPELVRDDGVVVGR
ncbi:hypothetical protein B0H16DRAFT_1461709 [Mycena metata]|uniref:Uncharacterized protein n=1 Tax=Mycena metata TaxID=1033252 RepID=A0AAD7N6W6_9AGAR|nr:hypothetical protein B0H16DRAFT_1461709 [Mycena metata]